MKSSVVDKSTAVIYAVVAILATVTDLSPVVFVLLAGVMGILLKNRKEAAK